MKRDGIAKHLKNMDTCIQVTMIHAAQQQKEMPYDGSCDIKVVLCA